MGQCCLRQAIGCARNLLEALCRDSSEEEARKADRIRSGPTKRRRPTPLHATHELEGDCARGGTPRRYQDAISRARPAEPGPPASWGRGAKTPSAGRILTSPCPAF